MIVGIEGNLGNGKSATMARMALHYASLCTECNGIINHENIIPVLFDEFDSHDCICEKPSPYKIHANFHISGIKGFHYVTNKEDIDKIYQGVFFGDEMWSWIDSRKSLTDINQVVSAILLNSRKRGFSIVYESKLVHMTDRRIRELTDYVLRPNKYVNINGELTKIEQHMLYPINMTPYMKDTWIVVDELSGVSLDMIDESLFQFKLSDIADKYNTREEIEPLSNCESSPGIEKGIKIENAFEYALRNLGREGEILRGEMSRGWDVVIKDGHKNEAFDVVSVRIPRGYKNPAIEMRGKNIEELLKTAKANKLTPYFAYEWDGKWFTLPMTKEHIGLTSLSCKDATELIKKED